MRTSKTLGWLAIFLAFCPIHLVSLADDFTDRVLLKAIQIAESLPAEEQCAGLCKIAIEYDRLGQIDEARQLSQRAIELFHAAKDVAVKDKMATSIAVQKIRAGDVDSAETFLEALSDRNAQDLATCEIAKSLCEMSSFETAVELAERIDKRNPVRFDAMEHIAKHAALGGNNRVSKRAARGMDPYGEEYAIRKMRWMCEDCQIVWKAGEKEYAIRMAEQNDIMKIMIDQDPATLSLVELTLAAITDEKLAETFDAVVGRMGAEGPAEKHRDVYRALCHMVVCYDRLEFAESQMATTENTEVREGFALALASKRAESGMLAEAEACLKNLASKDDQASIYLQLADFQIAQGNLDAAKGNVSLASDCLLQSSTREGQSSPVFLHLIKNYARLGEHDRAIELLDLVNDKPVALAYSLELIRSVSENSSFIP